MPRQGWVADTLRKAGLTVVTDRGWTLRGSTAFDPRGLVVHHTATGPNWTRTQTVKLLRDGRSDLAGPLSQFGLDRDGTWIVIAAGRANHAGSGGWKGLSGNSSVFGVECFNDGRGEPWPKAQVDALTAGVAAICARAGIDVSMVCGHKEWTPRKIDPRGLDMDTIRRRIQEDDMATPEENAAAVWDAEVKDDATDSATVTTAVLLRRIYKESRAAREQTLKVLQALQAQQRGDTATAEAIIDELSKRLND